MTTTLSSSPSGPSTAAPSAAPSAAFPERAKSGRLRFWAAIAVAVIMLAGGLTWAANWVRDARTIAYVDRFTVTPRSFNVVLKEKGELQAAKSTDIICEVEGRSTIIFLIPEGTAVKEGDLLVELASDEIEQRIRQDELKEANAIMAFEAVSTELDIQRDKNASDIRKANLKIELRQLALEKYIEGDWEQALKDADIEIERAELARENRTEDFEAAKQLLDKDFITKTEYDEEEFNYLKAGWDLEKARKALEVLTKYTHKADLKQKESDFEEALKERDRVVKNAEAEETKKVRSVAGKKKELDLIQDQLAKLREQEKKCRIDAPTQGFVVYYSNRGRHFMGGDSQIKEGASVHERQVLLSLPDTSEMNVVVRVHEAKTDKLLVGQPVDVKVEGLSEERFTGRVAKIAVLADSQNRWLNPDLKEYETEITLDQTEVPLKPGVTAYVEILVEAVADKLAVPVQAVYSKGGRRYVFRREAHDLLPVEIQLGAIGTEWAEVSNGLSGGEEILLAFSDDEKRLVPDLPPSSRHAERRSGPPPAHRHAARPAPPADGKEARLPKRGDRSHTRGGPRGGSKVPSKSAGSG